MTPERARLRESERWIAWVRVGGVGLALFQIGLLGDEYPSRAYESAAWATTGVFAVGAGVFWWLSRCDLSVRGLRLVGFGALCFDTGVLSAYMLIYSFEAGTPIRHLLSVALIEAAFRYGLVGGVLLPILITPVYVWFEWLNSDSLGDPRIDADNVTFLVGVQVIIGLIVGWLVKRLGSQSALAEARATEAERLRDQLGRRVDVLEAANRCARALGSSLELEEAFNAFLGELRGLVPFERVGIVLAEDGTARVMATAGRGAADVLRVGDTWPVEGSVLEEIMRGQAVYREDMHELRYREEADLVLYGLRSRYAVPLMIGSRAIGMLSVTRTEPSSFKADEMELVTLLGRLVATAVQNIRTYEAERRTLEELRRLSALRADFVSLVSHELRSPMAAVIGAARTLQQRWRELSPDQRESFLALIAEETSRLAALITDVLDTSRIEAGTFSYTFSDVDIGELVRDSATAAGLGQDEVAVTVSVSEILPHVRGDRERLRQVLTNLIENAVKYSHTGGEVRVSAVLYDGRVRVDVADGGPGISPEHQQLIFEKFGRVKSDGSGKPGTGLGLFIARSIAEAHGGSLGVRSLLRRGATFTLELPAEV